MKITKSLICLLIVLALTTRVAAAEVTLKGDVDIDWMDQNNFTIDVSGGDSTSFNCQQVANSSNYNNFDRTLTASVNYKGTAYESDVLINWRSTHSFRIETASEKFTYDCDDATNTTFNNYDETLDFEFIITNDETDEVTKVIQQYINYSEQVNTCQLAKLDAEKDRDNFEEKWTACESEGGSMKQELITLRRDNADLPSLKGQVASLTTQVSTCENEKQTVTMERDEANKKGSNGLLWGLGGAAIVWFATRKQDTKPPEQEELPYDDYPEEV